MSWLEAVNQQRLELLILILVLVLSLFTLARFLLYWFCGIWISSIDVFLWKASGIQYKNKKVNVVLKSFKIKINLFDYHHKLINFIAEGLTVELDLSSVASDAKGATENVSDSKEILKKYIRPISLYPSSQSVRFLLRHLTRLIPSIDLKIKDLELSIKSTPITLKISDIEFSTDYEVYKNRSILNFVTDLEVKNIKLQYDKELTTISTSLFIKTKGLIDLHEGIISDISLIFKSYLLRVPVFIMLKSFSAIKKQRNLVNSTTQQLRPKKSNATMFSEDVCLLSLVVNLVKETSIRFDDVVFEKIPLLSGKELENICDDNLDERKLVFLKGLVKSISANYSVLKQNNAGYDINFQRDDHPFQTVLTLMQVLVQLDLTHSTESLTCYDSSKVYELVNIPSITASCVTNTLFQLLKLIENGSKSTDSVWNYNLSISNPIVDISTDHLGLLISRFSKISADNKIYTSKRPKKDYSASSHVSRLEYFYYLSSAWPQINFKVLVERPSIILKTRSERRDVVSMLVLNVSLINIGILTTKHLDFEGNLVYYLKSNSSFSDLSLVFLKRSTNLDRTNDHQNAALELASDSKILKCSDFNLKLDSRILPSSRVTCTLDYGSFSVDLSDLVILNGLCDLLTDIDDNINELTNEEYEKLLELKLKKPKKKISEVLKEQVFTYLPDWFDHFKIGGKKLKLTTGSRSVLIPAEIINQLEIPDIIDNVDGSLRKVILTVLDWSLEMDNNKIGSHRSSTTNSSDKELTSKTSITDMDSNSSVLAERDFEEYWRLTLICKNVRCKTLTEEKGEAGVIHPYSMTLSNMGRIPSFVLVLKSALDLETNTTRLDLDGDCDVLSIHYSLISHFLILSSFHLLNNTLFKPVIAKYFWCQDIKKLAPKAPAKESVSTKLNELLKVFYLRINIRQLSFVNHFADQFKLKIDGLKSGILLTPGEPLRIRNTLFRMLVESPTSPGFWTRFLTVNNSRISVNIAKILNKSPSMKIDEIGTLVEIANTGCRISIPHQYIVHKMFDQISVAIKTMKQLHHSLKFNSNEIVIYPHEMKTPRIPKIKIKSKRFVFKMDDDPFETELNMIFQLGLIEQRRRLEKKQSYVDRLKEMQYSEERLELHFNIDNINVDGLLEPSKLNHRATSSSSRSTKLDDLDKKLFLFRRHISRSWIQLVRDYTQKMEDQIEANGKFLWSFLKASNYPPGFNHKLLAYSKSAPLMSLILENVDFTIKSPNFPLEKVPEYIHDIGKGVPLDTKYTIMIPLHIDLKVKELRIHLRDYPLPLLYIPAVLHDQDQSLAALRVSGTFIVSEELDERIENIRTIYVPLVPLASKSVNDKYFSLDVPKTIASIKVFTNLETSINSKIPSRFTWGQSFQPAIQQIILNFDDFTKPQLDPSEKVGFWDKVRSILHAKLQFKWAPEGQFIVALKGGRDPYSLTGLNAGFLLAFKDNVTLNLNKDDNPKHFLQVQAEEVTWSIANHLALPLLVWCKDSSNALFIPHSRDVYMGSVVGYHFENLELYDGVAIAEMLKHYSEKTNIALRGDVTFEVGLSFERKDADGSRTSQFTPHYKILLSNPKYIEDTEHYDAYKGFRSEYAHLSISLRSNQPTDGMLDTASQRNVGYNVVHLSPKSFTQFFNWWKLFSGNMQLPVRRGNLFGPNKASKKFSEVLSTLQFQFLISPLYLSHLYREDNEKNVSDDRIISVGLKAKTENFVLDLHQRKEAIVNKNRELDKTKSIQKMKMYLGEVDITNVDLRAVRSIFRKDRDSRFSEDDGILEFGNNVKPNDRKNIFYTYDNDPTWLDFDDFEEVALPSLRKYKSLVKIYPLLFTPRFTYLRQLDHTAPKGVIPVDNKLLHDCALGGDRFKETQLFLLQERLEELESQLRGASNQKIVRSLTKGVQNVKGLIENLVGDGDADELADEDTENGFNNKFLIHNVQVKWNKDVRDIVFKYTHFMTMRRAVKHYLRYQSYSVVQKIIDEQRKQMEDESMKLERFQTLKSEYLEQHHTRRDEFTYDDIGCSERLERFDEDLRSVLNASFKSSDDYLIKLISPQIQLSTDDTRSDSCVLVTAPKIDVKIVSIKQTSVDEQGVEIIIDNEDLVLEKRYGAFFKDTNIFVAYKRQVVLNALALFRDNSYGSTSRWPPWIGVELCYDGGSLKDNMILQRTSLLFRYDQLRELIRKTSLNDRKRLILDIPKVVTSCDSNQYFSFYDMVLNLLMYKEPSDTEFHEKLTSLILTTDFTDLDAVRDRIRCLQKLHSTLSSLGTSLTYKRFILAEEEREQMQLITEARHEIFSEIFLLMRLVSKGNKTSTVNKDEELEWTIRADDIMVHMLDEKRHPFIDLSVKNGVFRRIEESSNSNTNILQVSSLNAYNLAKDASFPEVILSYNPSHHSVLNAIKKQNGKGKSKNGGDADVESISSNVSSATYGDTFVVEWAMDKPVGGIKVIRNVIVNLLPLKISMEQSTGEKLINYLFPPTDTDSSLDSQLSESHHLIPYHHDEKHQPHYKNPLTLNNEVKHQLEMEEDRAFEIRKAALKHPGKPLRRASQIGAKLPFTHNGSDKHNHSNNSSSGLSSIRSSLDSLRLVPMKSSNSNLSLDGSSSSISSSVNSGVTGTPTSTSFQARTDPKYVSEMIDRASNYMSIVALTINSFVLNVSFRGEGKYRLVNVSDLTLKIPKLQFHNKIWTIEDLFNHIKKLVLKLLLSHSGVILANKLTHHKKARTISVIDEKPRK